MPFSVVMLKSYPLDMQELAKRIINRAGYNPDDGISPVGGEYQVEFRTLLETLAYIGARKQDDYGDFRLTDIRSWDRERWGAYWDVMRKFGRLEQQMNPDNTSVNIDDLMETLSDQAIYCVRMIQILRRLEEKGLVPK